MRCRICGERFYLASQYDPDPPESCSCGQCRDAGELYSVKECLFTVVYWTAEALCEIGYFILDRLQGVEL